MYRRRLLCTMYGAVDFLIVPYKGLYGWGVVGGDYVMLLYVLALLFRAPNGTLFARSHFIAQKVLISGPTPSNGPRKWILLTSISLRPAPYKQQLH